MREKIKRFFFENQTTRQTFAKNTVWLTVSNIGGRLIRAIIIIYAARVLGATAWGVFSYALSLVGLAAIFMDLGIGAVLTREAAKYDDRHYREEIVSTTFLLKLIIAAVVVVVLILLGPAVATIPEAKIIIPILSFVIVCDALREFGASLARALQRMEIEAGLYLLTSGAITALGLLALWLAPSVRAFSYAYVAGTAIGMIATFLALRPHLTRLWTAFSPRLLAMIFSSAWPVALSSLLAGLMLNTDMIILGALRSAEDVGVYAAAERISQIPALFSTIIAMSAFPIFSRLAAEGSARIGITLQYLLGALALVMIPIVCGGIILASQIVTLIYGAGYAAATVPFAILLLTLVPNFPILVYMNALFAYGHSRAIFFSSVVGSAANVGLDLLLIPQFGTVGSALATLCALSVSSFFLWLHVHRIAKIHLLSRLRTVGIATLCMSCGTFLMLTIGIPVLANILISAAVYFGILVLQKEPLLNTVVRSFLPSRAGEATLSP